MALAERFGKLSRAENVEEVLAPPSRLSFERKRESANLPTNPRFAESGGGFFSGWVIVNGPARFEALLPQEPPARSSPPIEHLPISLVAINCSSGFSEELQGLARRLMKLGAVNSSHVSQIQAASRKNVDEHFLYVKVPFLGVSIHQNNLGSVSSIVFVALALLYLSCIQRENENIRGLATLVEGDQEASKSLYTKLYMHQLFTVPPTPFMKHQGRIASWKTLLEVVPYISCLVTLLITISNFGSAQGRSLAWAMSPTATIIELLVSVTGICFTGWLASRIAVHHNNGNLWWSQWHEKLYTTIRGTDKV